MQGIYAAVNQCDGLLMLVLILFGPLWPSNYGVWALIKVMTTKLACDTLIGAVTSGSPGVWLVRFLLAS